MSLIDLSTRVEWLQFLLLLTNEPLPCEEALLRSPFDEPTFHASEGIKVSLNKFENTFAGLDAH